MAGPDASPAQNATAEIVHEERILPNDRERFWPYPYLKGFDCEVLLQRLKLAVEIFVADAAVLWMSGKQELQSELAQTVKLSCFGRDPHSFQRRSYTGSGWILFPLDLNNA